MRYILSILLLFTFYVNSSAQFISVDKAKIIASEFIKKNNPDTRSIPANELTLLYEATDTIQTKTTDKNSLFYIFNMKDKEGFIIVSGDTRSTSSILGYSFTNKFNTHNFPDNIHFWLDNYRDQLISLRRLENNLPPTSESKTCLKTKQYKSPQKSSIHIPYITQTVFIDEKENSFDNKVFPESLEPLIKTQWDQLKPYNNLTPMDGKEHSVTGCIATSTAQIMRYHQWPDRGLGEKTYKTMTNKMFVHGNFESSVYDWNNMLDTYKDLYTEKEANAVATLMRDAGIASEMDYTKDESGATIFEMGNGLLNHFQYSPNLELNIKDFYSDKEWMSLLKNQLNNNMPVLYTGDNNTSGHAFVCDGYDSNNLFHINWGWSGYCDGFFTLEKLNPDSPGTGGGSGKYNQHQMILTNIQRADINDVSHFNFYYGDKSIKTDSLNAFSWENKFNIKLEFYNYSFSNFSGQLAFGLKRTDNKTIMIGYINLDEPLKPLYGWSELEITDINFPETLPSGQYELYTYYKQTNEKAWNRIRAAKDITDHLNVTIDGDIIQIENNRPETGDEGADLRVIETFTADRTVFHENEEVSFHAKIKNTGKNDFEDYFGVYISGIRRPENKLFIWDKEKTTIPSGKEKELTVKGQLKLKPGKYNTHVAHKQGEDIYYFPEQYSIITIESGAVNNESISSYSKPIILTDKTNGKIIVKGESIQHVTLYDLSGKIITHKAGNNLHEIEIQTNHDFQNVYILCVKANGKIIKYKIKL